MLIVSFGLLLKVITSSINRVNRYKRAGASKQLATNCGEGKMGVVMGVARVSSHHLKPQAENKGGDGVEF